LSRPRFGKGEPIVIFFLETENLCRNLQFELRVGFVCVEGAAGQRTRNANNY